MTNPSQDSQSPGHNLNLATPEYEATEPQWLVMCVFNFPLKLSIQSISVQQ
jgi:hypothetical protein